MHLLSSFHHKRGKHEFDYNEEALCRSLMFRAMFYKVQWKREGMSDQHEEEDHSPVVHVLWSEVFIVSDMHVLGGDVHV